MYTQRNPPYENTLVIHNFTEADVGTYQCRAGPLTTSFTLVLAGKSNGLKVFTTVFVMHEYYKRLHAQEGFAGLFVRR